MNKSTVVVSFADLPVAVSVHYLYEGPQRPNADCSGRARCCLVHSNERSRRAGIGTLEASLLQLES